MMNMGGFSAPSSSSPSACSKSRLPSALIPAASNYAHHHRLPLRSLSLSSFSNSSTPQFTRLCCSTSPGGSPGSEVVNLAGESDSKTVLDAFFLGKALGEALTERIESAVGEFLSTVGRLQAEQQKQVQEFQDDVLERAKRAKEKAAREALEEQGRLIPNPTTMNKPSAATNGASSSTSPSSDTASPVVSVSASMNVDEDPADEDSPSSIPIE